MRMLDIPVLALPALLALSGCATSSEGATWKEHSVHFASGEHLTFSLRNGDTKTARVTEFGRRLDASVRRAGFAPLRLDLSPDTAFAAATIPLAISLTRRGDA